METIKEDENQESVSSTTSTMQETLSAGDIALVTAAVNSQASTSSSRTSNDRSQPSLELTPPCAVNLEKGGWFSMKTTTPNSDELSILTPESVHFIATSDSELGHEVEMGLISDSLIPSYKIDILDKTLNDEGGGEMIASLRRLGVKVYVIDGSKANRLTTIMKHVRNVTSLVARENVIAPFTGPLGFQRCLLYRDEKGRIYNMTFPQHAVGPVGRWREYLDMFSMTQAILAISVLCRSFPCIGEGETVPSLRPALLSLIFGIVLQEEIGLSLLNSSMLVRATPSISAHYLVAPVDGDLLRKVVVFTLAITGFSVGRLQAALTLGGIGLAISCLLANLGSRSWYFLRWKPMPYSGPGAAILAYILAVVTGIFLPYTSHKMIPHGGKGSVELILRSSLVVAALFLVSDLNQVRRLLVIGSEKCNQNTVNVLFGVWWIVSVCCSLVVARGIPYFRKVAKDSEWFLIEDHSSPVGYKVPKLPSFELDPCCLYDGTPCLSLQTEITLAILWAIIAGVAMIAYASADWEDSLLDMIKDNITKVA